MIRPYRSPLISKFSPIRNRWQKSLLSLHYWIKSYPAWPVRYLIFFHGGAKSPENHGHVPALPIHQRNHLPRYKAPSVRDFFRNNQPIPGSVILSRADFRITKSRAFLAASRARDEVRHLLTIALAAAGLFSKKSLKHSPITCCTICRNFGVHQFHFGLTFKLRIGMLDANHRCQPFPRIIT